LITGGHDAREIRKVMMVSVPDCAEEERKRKRNRKKEVKGRSVRKRKVRRNRREHKTHTTPVQATYAPCTGSLVGGGISPSSSISSSSSYLEVDRY